MFRQSAEAIARLERAGVIRERRIADPELRSWEHFRRRLGFRSFLELLLEDARQQHHAVGLDEIGTGDWRIHFLRRH